MNYKDEKNYFIAFNSLINFTHHRYKIFKDKFFSLEKAFHSSRDDFLSLGFKPDFVDNFIKKRSFFILENVLEEIEKESIKICTIEDDSYPSLLLNIFNPPPILYYKGDINFSWNNSLSVVGSRSCSDYGKNIIKDFIPSLAQSNIGIISGMAIGIDSLAHQETLLNSGKTIAVLGSGLDFYSIYPRENRDLFFNIIDKGGLIFSEFSLGTKALAFNFPQRNRIIAGLSRATLLVEASKKSGSLITARIAVEEGRDLFVFPGSIYNENTFGNNILIKNGANLVSSLDDILGFFDLNIEKLNQNKLKLIEYQPKNKDELVILNFLKNKNAHINEISESLNINIYKLGSILSILEMRGIIRDLGSKNYSY